MPDTDEKTKTDDQADDKGDDKGTDETLGDGPSVFDQEDPDKPAPGTSAEDIDWKTEARRQEARAKEDRKAAREAKKAADEAMKKLKEIEDADLSEKEKAEARAAELEEKLTATTAKAQKANLRAAIADAKTPVASVSDVAALLTSDGIEFDDDNEPVDFEAKLAERLEKSPHLAAGPGRVQGSADAGRGSGASTSLEDMSVEDHIQRMRKKD